VILIEDSDRWSREKPLDSLNALKATVDRGVEIVFLKTGVVVNRDNFNDPGTLFPAFFGSFLANSENEKRSYPLYLPLADRQSVLGFHNPTGQKVYPAICDPRCRPSLRSLRSWTAARIVPCVRCGGLIFYDVEKVKTALA